MNDFCVITFGKNYNFLKGVERLKERTAQLNIPFIGYTEYPKGCPEHEKSPYAFKFFCIKEAQKAGYSKILWLDTSVIINTPLNDVFDFIKKEGYFFIKNWHTVGDYCHDKALKTLNITRNQSFHIPCLQGTNFGLNLQQENASKFLDQMISYALDGITFPGPYTNDNNEASYHPKVLGHRHDQIAMSVASLRLNMNKWFPREDPWFYHDRDYVKNGVKTTVPNIVMSEK